ncbi:MAG: MFS transporter [Chloroflexi bacterium]|nr:MFS transporter [Chloroflexota bacterium]
MTVPAPAHWSARLPTGLRVFRHRNFRLFYFGQLVSLAGTWMQAVAQDWLILELTIDPVALGMVVGAQFLRVMVLGLFGGLAADALPKRLGLLCTQTGAMGLALVLGTLVLLGHVQVWQVMAMAFLLGIINAFDMPIRQSFVVEMVGRPDIASAVALNSAAFNAARIIGPAIAGLLIGFIGLAPLFLLNALSYLLPISGYLRMNVQELIPVVRTHVDHTAHAVIDSLVEGLRYVRATPIILLCIVMIGTVSVLALNFPVLGPLVARDILGGGAETYGFLMAAAGVGSLISALSLAFGGRATLARVFIGSILLGVAVAGVGLSSMLPVSVLLMGLVGWSTVAMGATTNTIIQLTVPDDLRGRVMSVYTTVFAGATPVGSVLAGLLAATLGVSATLLLAGTVTTGATVLAALWAVRRRRLPLWTAPGVTPSTTGRSGA